MQEGGYTDRQLPRLWASKTDIEAFQEACFSFLSGEKVEIHFYLCLSGMLDDPAAPNRRVVPKFRHSIYIFSSSFHKRHKIGKKSLF